MDYFHGCAVPRILLTSLGSRTGQYLDALLTETCDHLIEEVQLTSYRLFALFAATHRDLLLHT